MKAFKRFDTSIWDNKKEGKCIIIILLITIFPSVITSLLNVIINLNNVLSYNIISIIVVLYLTISNLVLYKTDIIQKIVFNKELKKEHLREKEREQVINDTIDKKGGLSLVKPEIDGGFYITNDEKGKISLT